MIYETFFYVVIASLLVFRYQHLSSMVLRGNNRIIVCHPVILYILSSISLTQDDLLLINRAAQRSTRK